MSSMLCVPQLGSLAPVLLRALTVFPQVLLLHVNANRPCNSVSLRPISIKFAPLDSSPLELQNGSIKHTKFYLADPNSVSFF